MEAKGDDHKPVAKKTVYERTLEKALGKNATAKALAYFVFREVIEDMHSNYTISQEEMAAMNKKAVNRAAAFQPSFFAFRRKERV
jgi:hypothetical protein